MLQGEHSALLSTLIKLPFSIKTFVLSIFKWQLKTGFTVIHTKYFHADGNKYKFKQGVDLLITFASSFDTI